MSNSMKSTNKKFSGKKTGPKRRAARSVSEAKVNITSSYNNTIVTVTDVFGKVLCFASSGSCGFSGSKKKSNLSAIIAAKTAVKKAIEIFGVKHIKIIKRGIGKSAEAAMIAVNSVAGPMFARVTEIEDRTRIAHAGCRQRKRKND
ncbi:MAG: 30S ribosomal protein S11 [Chlamydiia bacterium]|nr:30S ribosomal protein S11 [Chlamydiia bacterium]